MEKRMNRKVVYFQPVLLQNLIDMYIMCPEEKLG